MSGYKDGKKLFGEISEIDRFIIYGLLSKIHDVFIKYEGNVIVNEEQDVFEGIMDYYWFGIDCDKYFEYQINQEK